MSINESGWGLTIHCPPKYNVPILILLLVVLVWAFAPIKKAGAEMFPTPPMWYDVNAGQEGGAHVHYFEYKSKYCFVGTTGLGRVVNLQCGPL